MSETSTSAWAGKGARVVIGSIAFDWLGSLCCYLRLLTSPSHSALPYHFLGAPESSVPLFYGLEDTRPCLQDLSRLRHIQTAYYTIQ